MTSLEQSVQWQFWKRLSIAVLLLDVLVFGAACSHLVAIPNWDVDTISKAALIAKAGLISGLLLPGLVILWITIRSNPLTFRKNLRLLLISALALPIILVIFLLLIAPEVLFHPKLLIEEPWLVLIMLLLGLLEPLIASVLHKR